MHKKYYILLALAILVYIANMMVDVMEVDAAQYAEMSWEMSVTHNYLQLHCLFSDYLDKPPLLFWLNSIFFSLLGVSNFTYKLPSVLFVLLGVFSTYKFAKLYYDNTTASIAAVMLATTQAVFLITNDVRTDTMLMGAVIFAIWQLAEYFEKGKTYSLLLGGVGVALAMLTKGPIGLIAPGAAFFLYVIMHNKWKRIFDVRILLPILIIALMLLPMCIGLYQQWGAKGLRFYFWTQSFGRITGESEWNNHPDPIFLIHTTAWAFLPWTLFFFVGWLGTLYKWLRGGIKHANGGELISVAGFTLVLIMLMRSNYQLPHYIYVVYPLAAVIAAKCLMGFATWGNWKKPATVLQLIMLVGLMAVSALLQYAFKGADIISLLCLVILYPLAIWLAFKYGEPLGFIQSIGVRLFHFINKYIRVSVSSKQAANYVVKASGNNIFLLSVAVALVFNFMLGAFYFPAILKYQPGNDFGRYVKEHVAKSNNLVMYNCSIDFSTAYYAQHMPAETIWNKEDLQTVLNSKKDLIIITNESGIQQMQEAGIKHQVVEQRYAFRVAKMNLPFLNPNTRRHACEKVYLVKATAL